MALATAPTRVARNNIFRSKRVAWGYVGGFIFLLLASLVPVGLFKGWLIARGLLGVYSRFANWLAIGATGGICYLLIARLKRRAPIDLAIIFLFLIAYYFLAAHLAPLASDRLHLVGYSVLALFFFYALKFHFAAAGAYFFGWIATFSTSLIDEGLQSLIPNRSFDLNDLTLNALATSIALLFCYLSLERNRD